MAFKRNSRLSILIYHRVLDKKDPLQPGLPDAGMFTQQMRWLKKMFRVFPLTEAVQRLHNNTLPMRSAVITFDDGYSDNAAVALPILQAHGLTATFFIATGFLNNGRMWNDTVIEAVRCIDKPAFCFDRINIKPLPVKTNPEKRIAIKAVINQLKYAQLSERNRFASEIEEQVPLPQGLMMTTEQVKKLHLSGMEIGAHTVNHPILANLDNSQARNEITQSKNMLESMIQAPVTTFAYPNGQYKKDFTQAHENILQESGFKIAVTTDWGTARPWSNTFRLPRFTPWDKNPIKFTLRLLLHHFRGHESSSKNPL